MKEEGELRAEARSSCCDRSYIYSSSAQDRAGRSQLWSAACNFGKHWLHDRWLRSTRMRPGQKREVGSTSEQPAKLSETHPSMVEKGKENWPLMEGTKSRVRSHFIITCSWENSLLRDPVTPFMRAVQLPRDPPLKGSHRGGPSFRHINLWSVNQFQIKARAEKKASLVRKQSRNLGKLTAHCLRLIKGFCDG
jgi:hypothetical protein